MIGISGSRIWSKTLMELIFNPYGSLHLHIGAPGIFSDLLRSDAKERVGCGKHLIIPGKTTASVPEFALEDLPLAELQP